MVEDGAARVELWPGLLPLHEARWARSSRLVAAGGVLEVHRGRRVQPLLLRGCTMRPTGPIRDLQVSVPYVFVDAHGTPLCTVDLAEWVPGGEQPAGRRRGLEMDAPWEGMVAELAVALDASVSSTPWDADVVGHVRASDPHAFRRLQLALLVLAVAAFPAGVEAMRVAGGLAAIGLVALGMRPARRWGRRDVTVHWTVSSPRGIDEVSLCHDGRLITIVDSAWGRSGVVALGDQAHQVDHVEAFDDVLRFCLVGGAPSSEVTRRAWGDDAFHALRARLEQVEGLAVRARRRAPDRHGALSTPFRVVSGRYPELTAERCVALGLVIAVGAAVMATSSVLAAALYAAAAAWSLASAVELLLMRRRHRCDPTA